MNDSQARRLLKLANHLRKNVKPDELDMATFSGVTIDTNTSEQVAAAASNLEQIYDQSDYQSYDQMRKTVVSFQLPDGVCGTTACALGHATTLWPDVFRLEFYTSEHATLADVFALEAQLMFNEYHGTDKKLGWFSTTFSDEYIQDFFGINYYQACFAFSPWNERTPEREAYLLELIVQSENFDVWEEYCLQN